MRRMPPGLVLLVPSFSRLVPPPRWRRTARRSRSKDISPRPPGTTASGTLTASDEDGDPLVYRIVSPPAKGTLTLTDPAAGTFTIEVVSNILIEPVERQYEWHPKGAV